MARAARRGFTLIEILVSLTLMSIVSGIAVLSYDVVISGTQDAYVTQALATYIGGQQIEFDNRGGYHTVVADLVEIAEGYTYLDNDVAAENEGEISVAFGTDLGYDVVAAASVSQSGTCFIWRAHDPRSDDDDVKLWWDPVQSGFACTGDNALTRTLGDGEEW